MIKYYPLELSNLMFEAISDSEAKKKAKEQYCYYPEDSEHVMLNKNTDGLVNYAIFFSSVGFSVTRCIGAPINPADTDTIKKSESTDTFLFPWSFVSSMQIAKYRNRSGLRINFKDKELNPISLEVKDDAFQYIMLHNIKHLFYEYLNSVIPHTPSGDFY